MKKKEPHQETNPPFSLERLIKAKKKAERIWMIRENKAWKDEMEEERRAQWRRMNGY